ncbi:hypothetical protein [Capnocytophaga haemolytica]
MKRLNLKQMENVQGGGKGRECLLRGAAFTATIALGFISAGFWEVSAGIVADSTHCF